MFRRIISSDTSPFPLLMEKLLINRREGFDWNIFKIIYFEVQTELRQVGCQWLISLEYCCNLSNMSIGECGKVKRENITIKPVLKGLYELLQTFNGSISSKNE